MITEGGGGDSPITAEQTILVVFLTKHLIIAVKISGQDTGFK